MKQYPAVQLQVGRETVKNGLRVTLMWCLLVQLLRGTPQSSSCHLQWSRRDKMSPSAARRSASRRQLWFWRSWPMERSCIPPTAPSYWSTSRPKTLGFTRSTWPTYWDTRSKSSASVSEVSEFNLLFLWVSEFCSEKIMLCFLFFNGWKQDSRRQVFVLFVSCREKHRPSSASQRGHHPGRLRCCWASSCCSASRLPEEIQEERLLSAAPVCPTFSLWLALEPPPSMWLPGTNLWLSSSKMWLPVSNWWPPSATCVTCSLTSQHVIFMSQNVATTSQHMTTTS